MIHPMILEIVLVNKMKIDLEARGRALEDQAKGPVLVGQGTLEARGQDLEVQVRGLIQGGQEMVKVLLNKMGISQQIDLGLESARALDLDLEAAQADLDLVDYPIRDLEDHPIMDKMKMKLLMNQTTLASPKSLVLQE